jgi:hypothetical protein
MVWTNDDLSPECNTLGVSRLVVWHLHCMSLRIICSYMSMEYASATCETCIYGMCLQHLLETCATYLIILCFNVCMFGAHAW